MNLIHFIYINIIAYYNYIQNTYIILDNNRET